jgi:hypothetical protein
MLRLRDLVQRRGLTFLFGAKLNALKFLGHQALHLFGALSVITGERVYIPKVVNSASVERAFLAHAEPPVCTPSTPHIAFSAPPTFWLRLISFASARLASSRSNGARSLRLIVQRKAIAKLRALARPTGSL